MMMGVRLQELFNLMSQNEYRSATYFAQRLNVSLKTVRNDIKKLDCILNHHGASIESKAHNGYRLVVEEPEAFEEWFNKNVEERPVEGQNRNVVVLEKLLNAHGFVKIDDLCEMLYISRTSISASLRQIEDMLKEYRLKIIRKPACGIRIEGEEFDIRRLLCYCQLKYHFFDNERVDANSDSVWLGQTIVSLLNKYDLHLSEVALDNFANYVYVGMKRILSGYIVNLNLNVESFSAIGIKESSFCNELVELLESQFGVTYTADEKNYILLYLGGKQMTAGGNYPIESDDNFIFNREIDQLSYDMIELIRREFQISFSNNFELRMTLNRHLVPFDIRMKYGLPLTNPMIDEIKKNYSLAYDMAIRASSILKKHYKTDLSEDEIGYLALIFALQIDKDSNDPIKKSNVLIVSNANSSTMNVFKQKYEQAFFSSINHLYVSDSLGLRNFDFSLVDYVFTTVPILIEIPKPIFEINSFMEGNDMQSIEEALWRAESNELRRFYTPKRFLTNLKGRDKNAILKEMCEIVESQETVSSDFYELVMAREEYPHMMYKNQIALPHPNRICSTYTFAYIAVLDEPIEWNDEMIRVVLLSSPGSQDSKNRQKFYELTARFALDHEAVASLIEDPQFTKFIELLGI